MKREKIYVYLRQINKKPDDVYKTLLTKTKLDYRTIRALGQIVNNEESLTEEMLDLLLDEDFYTLDNVVKLYNRGLEDLIPSTFYENTNFLQQTKITRLPDNFIAGNKWINCFSLHDNITSIGDYAFGDCKEIQLIALNDKLKQIGNYSFSGCYRLSNIVLPSTLSEIGEGAFMGCEFLEEIELPLKIKNIKDYTFKKCTCLSYVKTAKEISVGREAFKNAEGLENISGKITRLGEEAFSGCEFLESVTLKCTTIPKQSFLGCRRLKTLHFESPIIEIGENAFIGCGQIKNIMANAYKYQLQSAKGEEELTKIDDVYSNLVTSTAFTEVFNTFVTGTI